MRPGYGTPLRDVPPERFNRTALPRSYRSPWETVTGVSLVNSEPAGPGAPSQPQQVGLRSPSGGGAWLLKPLSTIACRAAADPTLSRPWDRSPSPTTEGPRPGPTRPTLTGPPSGGCRPVLRSRPPLVRWSVCPSLNQKTFDLSARMDTVV